MAGLKIPGEVAAGVPLEPGERDDFPPLAAKLADPDVAGIILGTPVYFGNMSSLCKAFLDRCIVFSKEKALGNKVGGVVAVGGARNGGLELTFVRSRSSLMSQQMIVVGDAPPTGHWGGTVWAGAEAVKAAQRRHHPRRTGHGHGEEPRPPRGGNGPAPCAPLIGRYGMFRLVQRRARMTGACEHAPYVTSVTLATAKERPDDDSRPPQFALLTQVTELWVAIC